MYAESLSSPLQGRVVYREGDLAFDFEPSDLADLRRRRFEVGTLVAETLSVEVGLPQGIILYAWGYSPWQAWLTVPGAPVDVVDGVVMIDPEGIVPGVGFSLQKDESDVWWTQYDPESGWCNVTNGRRDAVATRVATDTVIGTDETGITSVWLRPTFLP
ncbi:hypothetical protein [Leifsonia sp. NPDC080035]|uniref:DUF3179 domain-containing protein n=1 Tax=Leifsonia sp. NPDC080035 TaxID=3143936 RepID=A0AAU7G9U8_9MICO